MRTSVAHSGRMRSTETPISSPPSLARTTTTETDIAVAATEGRSLASIIAGKRLVLTVAEAGELLGISRAFAYGNISLVPDCNNVGGNGIVRSPNSGEHLSVCEPPECRDEWTKRTAVRIRCLT